MRELGDGTEILHRGVGTEIGSLPIDALYWLGERGAVVVEAARAVRPALAAEAHTEMSALVAAVARDARDGDAVLVKASRAMKLDEFVLAVVDALQRRGGK
jgi:UDP-N-acetylmuramyl pentapeptide synthase